MQEIRVYKQLRGLLTCYLYTRLLVFDIIAAASTCDKSCWGKSAFVVNQHSTTFSFIQADFFKFSALSVKSFDPNSVRVNKSPTDRDRNLFMSIVRMQIQSEDCKNVLQPPEMLQFY